MARIDEANNGCYTNWFISGVYNSRIPTDIITRPLLDTLSDLWNKHRTSVDREEWDIYINEHLLGELNINTIYLGGE